LKEYKEFLEEAAKRDHRKIGKDQDLWFFDEISPGSCFFLPNGVRIYNALLELIRVSISYAFRRGFILIKCRPSIVSEDIKKACQTLKSIMTTKFPLSHISKYFQQ
jgi:threonyl-tRNA synthetase